MNPTIASAADCLDRLLQKANNSPANVLRLKDWRRVILWNIDGIAHYWKCDGQKISSISCAETGFTMTCSLETLQRVANGSLPFFIGLWGTGEIQFDGSFSDAYRLGYIFLSDNRDRRVIFISHCWLNINTRFPEGCAFRGANEPLIKTLLDEGLGVIQMPCPEFETLGLEKHLYGEITGEDLRTGFRKTAQTVARQIVDYQKHGYEIVGVLGMNPSPSCGVDAAKGKETMLGSGRDISEKRERGIFIEELQKLLHKKGISSINFFGIRRMLVGEAGLEDRLDYLKSQIHH